MTGVQTVALPIARGESADRPSNNGDRPKRNHDRGPKNDKSLDDLRAVLKSISKDEQERQAKKQDKQEKTEKTDKKQPKPDKSAPESGLRDALKQAIAGAEQKKNNAPENSKEKPAKANDHKPNDQGRPQSTLSDTPKKTEQPVSNQAVGPSAKPDDPLSPKKLERMMRVTGNDSAPLK